MTGESAAPRVLRSRLRIASTNGRRPWRSKSVRHLVLSLIWQSKLRRESAGMTGALASKFRKSRVTARRLGTVPSHHQTRTPCPPPRSPPSSPSPRRAPPRAARLGRLLARPAARSAPRRPTPSTRVSPCSSTATGSSWRPVRDASLFSRLVRAARTRQTTAPFHLRRRARTARAIVLDAASADTTRSRHRAGAVAPVRPGADNADARAPPLCVDPVGRATRTTKPHPSRRAAFSQRSSIAARTTPRSSTSD